MSTLTGKAKNATYKDLLQVSNSNSGIDATLRNLEDGEGTASKLQLSTTAVNINAVSALQISGVTVGVTASEFNVLSGITAGTALASKAVVLDSNKQIDELDIKTTFQLNNVTVSSTAAELNYNDVTTIGTPQASKSLVLDANASIEYLNLNEKTATPTTPAAGVGRLWLRDDATYGSKGLAYVGDGGVVRDIAEQSSITNLSSKGAGYYFDGTTSKINLGTSTNLDIGTGNGAYFLMFRNTGNAGAYNQLFDVYDVGTGDGLQFAITSAGVLRMRLRSNGVDKLALGQTIVADSKYHTVMFVIDRDSATGLKIFLDGKQETYTTQDDPASTAGENIASTGIKYLGVDYTGATQYFMGDYLYFIPFNCAITDATERQQISEGNIPAKYQWGSQTELITAQNDRDFSSGTIGNWLVTTDGNGTCTYDGTNPGAEKVAKILVGATPGVYTGGYITTSNVTTFIPGKAYKIKAMVYIPSANNHWTVIDIDVGSMSPSWIAVKSSANLAITDIWQLIETTFIASSDVIGTVKVSGASSTANDMFYYDDISITQIGAVAAYSNEGIGHYSLMDNSSNALHGIVSGATPLNLNIGAKQTAYLSTTSTTPTMTDVIPGGWKVSSISIETAQNLTVISATQETSSIALIAGKTLNNGKMVWSTMADHMLYASGTPKDIVFALTGNGGVGAKIYVELVRVF